MVIYTTDDTVFAYHMALLDLNTAEADTQHDMKQKPGPNNPEEASQFVNDINKAANQFA